MSTVREIIEEIIRVEGGYVDHPNDPGVLPNTVSLKRLLVMLGTKVT